ncbi:hypothetical protein TsFJ059_006438 [Trichoderma semiorbis]|uniref:SET domain-containing protein n=1 Tax=Trichoderma semiorbis TaxID=1491008 RepID=A0A9P8HF09_9HYPO|nr:hypothetical protein TsFJ059_006438 [Trichoderma semiorbis]
MEQVQALLQWAKGKQVMLGKNVNLIHVPGRGMGVIAKRRLKKGQTILSVPIEAIRSLHTVPRQIVQSLPDDISLHGLLAADLALERPEAPTIWRSALPTLQDFEATTPFMWHENLQALLPQASENLLRKQQSRFFREWDFVSKAFPSIQQEEYLCAWFIINTRTFYYETPEMKKYLPDDRMALLPVADFFNHADQGCKVSFSPEGYTILSDHAYNTGEEIYISYGDHSNDLLLTEYGFILSENRWDTFSAEEVILSNLSELQKAELQKYECLGPFTLSVDDTESWRGTQVALSLKCRPHQEWEKLMHLERDYPPSLLKEIDTVMIQVLNELMETAKHRLREINNLQVGQEIQKNILSQRWNQICRMATQIIERLKARLTNN